MKDRWYKDPWLVGCIIFLAIFVPGYVELFIRKPLEMLGVVGIVWAIGGLVVMYFTGPTPADIVFCGRKAPLGGRLLLAIGWPIALAVKAVRGR